MRRDNADVPGKRIADRVHLSTSVVERRISEPRQDGVIQRIVAVIDPKAVDRGLSVLVALEIQNEYRDTLEPFQRWIDAATEVQSCWYVTGDMDFAPLVAARDLEDHNDFIERLTTEQRAVVRK